MLIKHEHKSIVTEDEQLLHYDNPRKRKSFIQHRQPNHIYKKKLMLCFWWNQLRVVYYELLKANKTITGGLYRDHLLRSMAHCLSSSSHHMNLQKIVSIREELVTLHESFVSN